RIILGCSTAIMLLMFVFFFSRSLFDSRFIVIAAWLLSIIFVIVGRGLVRLLQHALYHYKIGVHRMVVIGTGGEVVGIIKEFSGRGRAGFRVVDELPDFSVSAQRKLKSWIKSDRFDEILVAGTNLTSEELAAIHDFSYVHHVGLKFVADIFEFPITNFEINTISGLPIVEVKKTRLDGWGKVLKRVFDIIGSSLLILALSPILIVTALAIMIDSRGPIFFSYERIGENGRPFRYFKFRSMIRDAHKYRFDKQFIKSQQNVRKGTPMMKFAHDPRVTRVGRFIRRFSLDELPELFNVLRGKMSLVGPRPHEVQEVAKYATHHRKVLTIKPGMSGMAQVSGRSDLDFEEEVRLDTWYIEHWSIKLDLMILFKTPWAVIRRRGAE
nr:sugar transferase [Candidatus Buchananbacteria bacterium]